MLLFQLLANLHQEKSASGRGKRLAPATARLCLQRNRRLALEQLEDRLTPVVTATQVGGLLTVNFGATGDVGTIVGTDTTGSFITVSGTGMSSTAFTGVGSITVTQTPTTSSQAVTLQTSSAVNTILAPGGALTVTGIATTTLNGTIKATTVTGNAPTVNVQSGNFASINVGIALAAAGATVNVADGQYAEDVNDIKGVNLTVAAPSSVQINSLAGIGASTVTLSGNQLITGDTANTTFAGTMTGAGGLAYIGTGSLTLSGDNSFGGTAVWVGGALVVTGSLAAAGGVTLHNAALDGTGTVASAVAVDAGGTLSPGVSGPGILTVSGVTLASGATFAVTVNGPTAGAGYSQLVVSGGSIALGNAALNLNVGSGFTPAPGSVLTLIVNHTGAAVGGAFNTLAEGASVAINASTSFITYAGNTGADVTLAVVGPISFTAVPTGSNFTLRRSGSNLQTLLNGNVMDARPLSAVTSGTFTGANNVTNTLTIDLGFGGFFSLPGAVAFDGGASGADKLTVTGGNLLTDAVSYTTPGAGSLALATSTAGPLQVSFANTTALDVSGNTTATLNFQLPMGIANIAIADNGDSSTSSITGANNAFVPTSYKDATSVVLVTATGSDAIYLTRTAATKANYVLNAGAGSNTLTVDFSGETVADGVFLTPQAIDSTNFQGPIWYSATGGNFAGSVTLRVGSGGNFVIVQGTQAGAPTLVQTGTGNDNIIVSSSPNPLLGQLNDFAATLAVEAHGSDHLIVSDVTSTASDAVWVTGQAIAFVGEQFVLWYRGNGGSFSRGVDVALGSGANTFIVLSEAAGTPTSLYGNGYGGDTYEVGVTNTSAYANLLLDGGNGNNTLEVFDQSGGAALRRSAPFENSGTLQAFYPFGMNSTIDFANMEQLFANVAIGVGIV